VRGIVDFVVNCAFVVGSILDVRVFVNFVDICGFVIDSMPEPDTSSSVVVLCAGIAVSATLNNAYNVHVIFHN